MRHQDVKNFQSQAQELLKQHQIYLEYIGLFDQTQKELVSVCQNSSKSEFYANYAFIMKNTRSNMAKMIEEKNSFGKLNFFLYSLKSQQILVGVYEGFIYVITLLENISNLPFVIHIRSTVENLIKETTKSKQ